MQLDNHACDLACERRRLGDIHLDADDVLNEREDEIADSHAPILLLCHLAKSSNELLVAWSVKRLGALHYWDRDDRSRHWSAFERRSPASEVVLGRSRSLLTLSLFHLLFS